MDQSFTLSNSPSPVKKLSGNAQQAFDLAGELYSLTQQWNLLNVTGSTIISQISQTQVEVWENQVDSKELNELLEAACDRLGSVCNDMERLVKQMGKIRDQFAALEKLEQYHQQSCKSGDSSSRFMFLTWPAHRFVLVVTSIRIAYEEELQTKKCILENVARCENRETLNFHKIAWVYQTCLTASIKLQLESLLVETGQR